MRQTGRYKLSWPPKITLNMQTLSSNILECMWWLVLIVMGYVEKKKKTTTLSIVNS